MIGLVIIILFIGAMCLDVRRVRYARLTRRWIRMDLKRTRAEMKRRRTPL